MKSYVLFTLAILLTTAILAPSVITLTTIDEQAITIDFNEEEKKEEKKEAKEKDLFLEAIPNHLAQLDDEKNAISFLEIKHYFSTSLVVFLPPPEHFM